MFKSKFFSKMTQKTKDLDNKLGNTNEELNKIYIFFLIYRKFSTKFTK